MRSIGAIIYHNTLTVLTHSRHCSMVMNGHHRVRVATDNGLRPRADQSISSGNWVHYVLVVVEVRCCTAIVA